MNAQLTAVRAGVIRLLAILTALASAFALAFAAPPAAAQEDDDGDVTPARVSGENRFDTAAMIAELTFESAQAAIVVTGEDYPDALAASFAAGSAVAPVLLVNVDRVPTRTLEALDSLGVEDVVLLGGTGAISAEVESALSDEGYDTTRIAGTTRFETAAEVALTYGGLVDVGTLDGDRTAFLASGEDERFADALAAGPLAASATMPLLLTPQDRPSPVVDHVLDELAIERVVIVGGGGAVSGDVAQHYADAGYEVERFSGRNRTETAVVVAENAVERFGFDPSLILLARGDDYPDALSASIHGALADAPILLTANPTVLSPATEGHLFDLCPDVDTIRALGGTAAVSEQALSEAVSAAGQCRDDAGDPAFAFCGNTEDGYTVSYPDRWVTNIERIDEIPPCSLFDPDRESFEFEGNTVPADIGAFLRVEDVDFDTASNAAQNERELSREVTEVDGRTAVRLEVVVEEDPRFSGEAESTRWVVDVDDGTFIAVTYDIGEPDYVEKQSVLDGMMDAITFDTP